MGPSVELFYYGLIAIGVTKSKPAAKVFLSILILYFSYNHLTGLGYGIITDVDIRRAVEKYGESLFKYSALDLMSPHAQQIAKSTRVEDALSLMDKKAITTLLVVDQDKLCGVLKK